MNASIEERTPLSGVGVFIVCWLVLWASTVTAEHKPTHANSNAGGLPAAQAELAQCNATLTQTQAELGAANAQIASLTTQVADLSSTLATTEESLADCETSLSITQSQLTEALAQVTALVGQNGNLLDENAALGGELAICEGELAQCQTEVIRCPCNFVHGLAISNGSPFSCEVRSPPDVDSVGMTIDFISGFLPSIGMGVGFNPSWVNTAGDGIIGSCRESDNEGSSTLRLIDSVAEFGRCFDDLLALAQKPTAEGGMGLTCTVSPSVS